MNREEFFNHVAQTHMRSDPRSRTNDASSWELYIERKLEPIRCARWEGGPVEDTFDLEGFDWVWESLTGDVAIPSGVVDTQCPDVVKEKYDSLWIHRDYLRKSLDGCTMRLFGHQELEADYLEIASPNDDKKVVISAFMGDWSPIDG